MAGERAILKSVFLDYDFRLKKLGADNTYKILSVAKCTITSPLNFTLDQNYLNPTYTVATTTFSVPIKSNVSFENLNLIRQKRMTVLLLKIEYLNNVY